MMNTQQTSPMLERVAELEHREDHAETFHHVDGSVTVVAYDFEPFNFDSPRDDYDGNVAHLVMLSRDYRDLDDRHSGIETAADRWGYDDPRTARYVAMFRPDVVLFEPHWTVQGVSQGDYAYGYAYVLREDIADLPAIAYVTDADLTLSRQARYHLDAELKVYGQHFRGDYYYATHLTPSEPELVSETVDYAADPVDRYGEDFVEDSCYGFLGYESLADIARDFTGSEIVS